jgi:hypothetical protein
MKKLVVGCSSKGKTLGLIAAMFVFASAGWASTASCNATKATLGSFSGGTNPGGPGQGCYETDDTFSQFNVTNGSTGTGSTMQTNATDNITGSTNFAAVSTPWTETATFTPTTTADWTITGRGGAENQGTINMIVNSNEAEFTDPSYHAPTAGDQIFFSTLGLATVGSTGRGTTADSLVVIETYCIGSAVCTSLDTVTITATYGNNATTPTFMCNAGTSSLATCAVNGQSATFNGGANVTTLNVTDQYTSIVNVRGEISTTDTLTSFANSFGDFEGSTSPEPSTFVLLGSALAGLGFVRLRRKKA